MEFVDDASLNSDLVDELSSREKKMKDETKREEKHFVDYHTLFTYHAEKPCT